MKLVIDVCIIGFTNSGKSALLSALSSARPEIADYQCTTRTPVLGVVDDGVNRLVWAELPALIKGSSHGKGLGNKFLSHADRALVLVFLLDASSADLRRDFEELRNEVSAFSDVLTHKAAVIAINKSDVLDDADVSNIAREMQAGTGLPCIMISALDKRNIGDLISEVHRLAAEVRNRPSSETEAEVVFRPKPAGRRSG